MERAGRIGQLFTMLDKEPKDLFLNYALGIEYSNDPTTLTKAEDQFKRVLELDENYIAAYYQLGKLYETLHKINQALDYYKTGLAKAKEQKNNKAINEFGEAIFMLEE